MILFFSHPQFGQEENATHELTKNSAEKVKEEWPGILF